MPHLITLPLLLAGYLLGSIPSGYLAGRWSSSTTSQDVTYLWCCSRSADRKLGRNVSSPNSRCRKLYWDWGHHRD